MTTKIGNHTINVDIMDFRFEERLGFPGVLGAVDCTLPKITAPADHEEAFLNYRRQHSLSVQVVSFVCDTCSFIIYNYEHFRQYAINHQKYSPKLVECFFLIYFHLTSSIFNDN